MRHVIRLVVLLCSWDPEPIEILTGLMGVAWGLWMLNPLWATFSTCELCYRAMAQIMPEWAWGLLLAGGGLFQITCVWLATRSLASAPKWQILWEWRRRAALCSFATWLFVTISFALGDYRAPGTPIYACLALSSLMAFARMTIR